MRLAGLAAGGSPPAEPDKLHGPRGRRRASGSPVPLPAPLRPGSGGGPPSVLGRLRRRRPVPVFGLVPAAAAMDAPAWTGSIHRGPCYVAARDERRARLYAANLFTDQAAARTPSGLLPASPWLVPALVTAERAIALGETALPEGTVMVPADPHDPRGAHRVLGTGRMVFARTTPAGGEASAGPVPPRRHDNDNH